MARILLVDDDPGIRRIFRTVLGSYGHVMDEASGAAEAILLVKGQRYDLVITDHHMAGGDGIALIDAVRTEAPRLPVILMTGMPDRQIQRTALQHGARHVLVKPVMPSTVRAVLDSLPH